jgi:hypothetical protein
MEFLIRFPVYALWRTKAAPLALNINERPGEFYLPFFSETERAGVFGVSTGIQNLEMYELDKPALIRLLRWVNGETCHWCALDPSLKSLIRFVSIADVIGYVEARPDEN